MAPPASPDEIEAYYRTSGGDGPRRRATGGPDRPLRRHRGVSPLAERTRDQAARHRPALAADGSGRWVVALGNKHAPPFVEEPVAELAATAADIVGLVLAPHYSRIGGRVPRAGGRRRWRARPRLRRHRCLARRTGVAGRPGGPGPLRPWRAARETSVLFTAHSLPERVLATTTPTSISCASRHPPSPSVPGSTPRTVGARVAVGGPHPEPWRGPDVRDVIRDLAATGRTEGVLVCPQGFVSDHLEVLYDLDVDARRVATEVGPRVLPGRRRSTTTRR